MRSISLLAILALATGCGSSCGSSEPEPEPTPAAPALPALDIGAPDDASLPPHLVVMVVLDTVRADHTSLCGYERPTTPNLARLATAGAAFTCRAYAPAPWTLPSHASFFTGTSVTEHGAMWVSDSDVAINDTIRARPLGPEFETLAETFKARGYQTVAVTANTIINGASGLLQGFDQVAVSPTMTAFRKRKLLEKVKQKLTKVDPTKPLFLFVNIYDAHDPYPAVPKTVPWLEPQKKTPLDPYTKAAENPFYRFVNGDMTDVEAGPFLDRIGNGYDMGISHADRSLGELLTGLIATGWTRGRHRLIVTSDHGELLGEHGMLRHSGFIYEGAVRVPFVYVDSAQKQAPPLLPEPFSAVHAYHLALDGRLPETVSIAHTVSEKNPESIWVGQVAGAVWSDHDKLACIEGAKSRWDLAADPNEDAPLSVGDHSAAADLEALCEGITRLHALPPPSGDAALMEALKAAGYVE